MKKARAALMVSVISLLACLGDASAADKGWVEVRSPHFRVLSDGRDSEARAVARQFEQMRVAFATAFPSLRLDSPVPLLILATKDENSLKKLLPEMWKRNEVKGGFFIRDAEMAFALVRLDVVRRQAEARATADGYQVLYHEYTHSLLNANFRWLPDWLNEGLAEFFGNTEFRDNKIYLGAPNIRAQYTRGRSLIPLETLIGATLSSQEYQDQNKVQMFYSESWGLVHLLFVPPSAERGRRLQQFLTLLEKGTDQKDAFREAIGDFKTTEEHLKHYLDQDQQDVFIFNSPADITDDALRLRQLSSAETDAELGTVEVWLHENSAARQRLEQSLKDDPRSALAAQAMGFLKFSEGKDLEAIAYFDRALKANEKLYLSLYYRTMLQPDTRAVRAALNRVVELNPQFAPAYVQLALGYFRDGEFAMAIPLAVKAQQLVPSKAGYHLLIANILHALASDSEAAAIVRFVADLWQGIDRDEAAELWRTLPAEVRRGVEVTGRPTRPGAGVISGKIGSVVCGEKDQVMNGVIDGMPFRFRVSDDKVNIGLSDLVWFSSDHFDRCHHLEGLRATIQYTAAGEPVQFDISAGDFPYERGAK